MPIPLAARYAMALFIVCTTVACSVESSTTPLAPTPTQVDVSGRWSANITVQGVTGRMVWTLTQSSGGVSGPVLVTLPNGVVLLNGALNGALNGSSLPYTVSVGPGAVPAQPTCTGQFGGTMTVASTSMSGPMALISSNCSIAFPSNAVTLTKQ